MSIMKEVDAFLAWCAQFHNSPDHINLHWWNDNRRLAFYDPQDERNILTEVRQRLQPSVSQIAAESLDHGDNDDMNKPHKRNSKGRAAGTSLLKTLKTDTLQGRIVSAIMKQPATNTNGNPSRVFSAHIDPLLDDFMMDRHPFLTTVNVIARTTGIGYSVQDDRIILTLPPNVADPFEFEL